MIADVRVYVNPFLQNRRFLGLNLYASPHVCYANHQKINCFDRVGIMQLNLEFESAPTIADEFAPSERLVMLHADALAACRQLPDAFFSLIITSPPYNIGKSYEKQEIGRAHV